MNRAHVWTLAAAALVVMGCASDKPVPYRDEKLGFAAVFPGPPLNYRFSEQTPFGTIEWFSRAYHPAIRFDQNFQVDVGNLPPGTRGGSTPEEAVETYYAWLLKRFGKVDRTGLPAGKGMGIRYHAMSPSGSHLEGILIIRRGRLHRAEASVTKARDPKAQTFLESFEVLP